VKTVINLEVYIRRGMSLLYGKPLISQEGVCFVKVVKILEHFDMLFLELFILYITGFLLNSECACLPLLYISSVWDKLSF
jgi:hypothetical protein